MQHSTSTRKIRVGIVFGGKSAEHEVSIQSAMSIYAALDTAKFEAVPLYIDRRGAWHANAGRLLSQGATPTPPEHDAKLAFLPGATTHQLMSTDGQYNETVDVLFPVLHGPFGEDGTVQGLLEVADIPYVGPGVLSSAIGMDKDITKRLLHEAGIPIAPHVVIRRAERLNIDSDSVIAKLGLPLFVKPANMGSSIGVCKVTTQAALRPALDAAFRYDRKVLVETAIIGDEVECAVLGNERPEASIPGRVITQAGAFYDYREKYHDTEHAFLEIPANISSAIAEAVRSTALEAFRILGCEGMARVDMFVTKSGEVLVNEVNTIPGFTEFSMYPKLWQASDIPYSELITKLINLAIERHEQRQTLATQYHADPRIT